MWCSGVYLIEFHMKVCQSFRCSNEHHVTTVYLILHLRKQEVCERMNGGELRGEEDKEDDMRRGRRKSVLNAAMTITLSITLTLSLTITRSAALMSHLIWVLHTTGGHSGPDRGLIHRRCGSVWIQIRQQCHSHTGGVT